MQELDSRTCFAKELLWRQNSKEAQNPKGNACPFSYVPVQLYVLKTPWFRKCIYTVLLGDLMCVFSNAVNSLSLIFILDFIPQKVVLLLTEGQSLTKHKAFGDCRGWKITISVKCFVSDSVHIFYLIQSSTF